jgi:dipeptidyl aminopeptidase/acylaminoacyl peptidase
MGLYRWSPGAQAPKQILDTPDVIVGCVPEGSNLLCTQESSLQPRRIVRIDVATGGIEPVFDPNPEFKSLRFGAVERLEWTSKFGLSSWGELVLPPDYHPGQKLPLIVVQYRPRGFQRGGIGDEYPIQLFAARGYAVLHFNQPASINAKRKDLTELDATKADYKDSAYRTTSVDALQTALNLLVARGIVDPARIGITGLSSGSENARYAIVNTHLFAAASISGDGNEPRATMVYYGRDVADRFASYGLPRTIDMDESNRDAHSMAMNAKTMHTPLLMQVADSEYLSALEGFTALHEAGQPVDMYVFPDEYHLKWQPAHRAAIYARNLDWFDFWLKGTEDPDPAKREQYERWEKLRAAAAAKAAAP